MIRDSGGFLNFSSRLIVTNSNAIFGHSSDQPAGKDRATAEYQYPSCSLRKVPSQSTEEWLVITVENETSRV